MSGGLFVNALLRETGHRISPEEVEQVLRVHAESFSRYASQVRPLPGSRELLDFLSRAGAYHVYKDPSDLLLRLDEVGVRAAE